MKKMVKLLSVVLLISMLFGMMAAGASAIVDSEPSQGGIVLGGPSSVSVSDSGNMVIGADQRPEDDSPFMGVRVEDIESGAASNAAAYGVSLSSSERLSIINELLAELEEQEAYNGQSDSYPGIDDSEDVNVQLNKEFLMYIRDNMDKLKATEDGQKTLKTAIELFGEDAVNGSTPDLTALQAEYNDLQAQILAMQAAFKATQAAENATEAAAQAAEDLETESVSEAAEPAAEAAPETEPPEASFGVLAAETSFGAGYNSIGEVPEYQEVRARFMEIAAELKKFGALPGMVTASAAGQYSADWSEISSKGSSLASAVAGGGKVKFDMGNSFDICNSTSYRITINLQGATIDATEVPAAFTIQNGTYGGTITFTNGTINGDGFYVFNGGVLNLGGLVNRNLDITVNAQENAVYVDEGGTCVIGQGTTLNGWLPGANATENKKYSTEPVVDIEEGGVVRMTGGVINAGKTDTVDKALGVYVNGGLFEVSSSVAEISSKNGAPAVSGTNGAEIDIHAGFVYGSVGIAVDGEETTLTVNGGNITGYAQPTSELNQFESGAAIEVLGTATDVSGDSPMVYVNGGTLRSEYSAGVVNLESAGSRVDPANRPDIKRITVDDVNVTIQQKRGETSDYAKAVYIVSGHLDSADGPKVTSGYATLEDAAAAAADLYGAVTVKMIDDQVKDLSVAADFNCPNADSVVFDGNGHTVCFDDGAGLTLTAPNDITVQNVIMHGLHSGTGITVNGPTAAYIGPSVYVDHFDIGLDTQDGEVTVNGLDIDNDSSTGIQSTGGKTTVAMCKVDSRIPVKRDGGTLTITGGWFLYKADPSDEDEPSTKVASFVDPETSYVKYVEKDRYYEVLYNDTPTVEIKAGATGYEADGTPYVKYDKADPDPIIFTITPAIKQITAVAKDGSSYPIFSAQDGKSGDIRIPDSKVLMDCPAGAYDLVFEFKNGYILKDKLSFYVFPKFAGLFAVPNTKNLSPSILDDSGDEINNGKVVKYLTNENRTDTYSIGSNHNILVVTSELPDKITVGNVADGSEEMLLENYILGDITTYGIVPSGPYEGYYFYFISYADLNNLAAGQNYVFLDWDGIDGALKRLPLTIKNSAVSISPTSIDWSKIDTFANFTVKPSVDTVYIDGEKVEESYWDYNTDNHVLSIKGTFLKALENKEHNLEVITPLGKVNATLNTGIGLRAKNIDYHVYGGAKALSFVTSDKINKEAGIWIGSSNPTKLDPSAYTWDGETGFTLSPAFLNRLALGTYYISCYVYNGTEYEYTTTTFKVISASQASYTPSTGDNSNIVVWLVILVLSAVAIVVIILPRLKKGKTGK